MKSNELVGNAWNAASLTPFPNRYLRCHICSAWTAPRIGASASRPSQQKAGCTTLTDILVVPIGKMSMTQNGHDTLVGSSVVPPV